MLRSSWGVLLLIAFFLLSLLLKHDLHLSFIFLLSSILCAYLVFLLKLFSSGKFYLTLCFFCARYLYEVFFLLLYTVFSENHSVFNNRFRLNYLEHSVEIGLCFLIPLLAALVITLVVPRKRLSSDNSILSRSEVLRDKHFAITLTVMAFNVMAIFSDQVFDVPFLSYIARVAHAAFLLFAFWVGFWNRKLKMLWPISLAVLLLEIVFTVLSGGRFTAFLILGLLYLGYAFSLKKTRQRRFATLLLIILAPFVLYVVGVLGYIRDSIGRGDYDIVTSQRVEVFADAFINVDSKVDNGEDFVTSAIARNIKWPNLSVAILSPDRIPFRGSAGWENELNAIFEIAGVSDGFSVENVRTARERNIAEGLGTGMANKYGYYVTRLNSVEWSILADSWSRGGPALFFFYAIFVLLGLLYFERIILNKKRHPADKALLIAVFIQLIWFQTGSVPMYMFIRTVFLYLMFTFVLLKAVTLIPKVHGYP